MKLIRLNAKETKQENGRKLREKREREKVNKKKKEVNELRSGRLQIIKDTKKIKKWNKNLRSKLVKLPAQMFEDLLRKKGINNY